MNSREVRERLGMSRGEFARCLGVAEPTVFRWEKKEGSVPKGLASEVLNAIDNALAFGVDGKDIGRRLRLGIAALIYFGITSEMPIARKDPQ